MKTRYLASVLGLIAFGLLAAATDAPDGSSSSSSGGTASVHRPAPAPASPARQLAMPPIEQQFCDAVNAATSQYNQASSAGSNQLKLSKLRSVRRAAILGAVHGKNAKDWVGTIDGMETTSDGKAVLDVKLPCGVSVKTWNNGLSDISDNTLIPQSSPVYDTISNLAKNSAITFSGKFFSNDVNGFKEISVTEEGSMSDPEFLFRFAAVSAL